jgi:hypothetical protein
MPDTDASQRFLRTWRISSHASRCRACAACTSSANSSARESRGTRSKSEKPPVVWWSGVPTEPSAAPKNEKERRTRKEKGKKN